MLSKKDQDMLIYKIERQVRGELREEFQAELKLRVDTEVKRILQEEREAEQMEKKAEMLEAITSGYFGYDYDDDIFGFRNLSIDDIPHPSRD